MGGENNSVNSILVITSGKGGAGKSTVTVGLGNALASLGKKVLLIDGDAGLRSLDIMLGIDSSVMYNLADIFEGKCEPVRAIYPTPFCEGLFIVPAPLNLGEICSPSDMRRLCRGFSRYFDYVLIDSPAGIGKGFECAVSAANDALIVSTPDLVCARSANAVGRILIQKGVSSKLIINRLRSKPILAGKTPDIDEIIDAVGSQLIGVIPEDEFVSLSTANGLPLPLDSNSYFCFKNISLRILGKDIPLADLA